MVSDSSAAAYFKSETISVRGESVQVVVIGKEFEDSMVSEVDESMLLPKYPTLLADTRIYCIQGVMVYINDGLGEGFSGWSGILDKTEGNPYAPRGLVGPWYIPVDEYVQWNRIHDSDTIKIADCFRYGLKPNEYEALRTARPNTSAVRTLAAIKEGWVRIGLTPSDEEITKLAIRTAFAMDARGWSTPNVISKVSSATATLSLQIAHKTGQDWFSERVRELFSLCSEDAIRLVVGTSNKVTPPSGLIPSYSGKTGRASENRWRAVRGMIDRSFRIADGINPSLSFETAVRLMSSLRTVEEIQIEMSADGGGGYSWVGRPHNDISTDLLPLLTSDDQAGQLCEIINLIDGRYIAIATMTDVIEMIDSGVPTDWIISSSLEEVRHD